MTDVGDLRFLLTEIRNAIEGGPSHAPDLDPIKDAIEALVGEGTPTAKIAAALAQAMDVDDENPLNRIAAGIERNSEFLERIAMALEEGNALLKPDAAVVKEPGKRPKA